jgi:hypothetical protein
LAIFFSHFNLAGKLMKLCAGFSLQPSVITIDHAKYLIALLSFSWGRKILLLPLNWTLPDLNTAHKASLTKLIYFLAYLEF